LPPYGACLLGSFNLVKYIFKNEAGYYDFNWLQFEKDIPQVVRAMDNIIDRTIYPLPQQEQEAKNKRRMGLGYTGLANAAERMGMKYGSTEMKDFVLAVTKFLSRQCYLASVELAKEKGPFPLYDEKYLDSKFLARLGEDVVDQVRKYGIRNSHLTSIAPTGTISLTADNVSSGIEPPYCLTGTRTIQTFDGPFTAEIQDYAYRKWGIEGVTADECTAQQHVEILCAGQYYIDSSVSKTCNVGPNVSFSEFKDLYIQAYKGGAKGCTTFRANGKRFGILQSNDKKEKKAEACYYDPATGTKTCE